MKRLAWLATALLVALWITPSFGDTTDVVVNGKKIGEIRWTDNNTRGGKPANWGGGRLIGGYVETDPAAAAAADCAQLRWIQVITTNCPGGGCVSPYVDPCPNPDPPSPYYWDDTRATSGAGYADTTFHGKDGFTRKFEDLPARGFALCPLPITWCAEVCLVCVKADGTVVPLSCYSWGYIINADSTVTNKPLTHLASPESLYSALKKDFPAVKVGTLVNRGLNEIPVYPYGPTDSLAYVNSTGRTQCDLWVHSYESVGSVTPNPIDRIRVSGKNWHVVSPPPDGSGDPQPPSAWVKIQADGPSDCLATGQHIFIKIGGGPTGSNAKGKEVRVYPTNLRNELIVFAQPVTDPAVREVATPIRDLVADGMYVPGDFSAVLFNGASATSAIQFQPSYPVPLLSAQAYAPDGVTPMGVWDGSTLQFSTPLPPGEEIDLAYHFPSEALPPSGTGDFVMDIVLVAATSGVGAGGPGASGLRRIAPNPVLSRARVEWSLPLAGTIDLGVFDVRGRRVATLVHGAAAAGPGSVEWDGRGRDGKRLPAGLYFMKLDAPGVSTARRVVVMK